MAETTLTPTPCRAVVIGGSSGSIDVLLYMLPALPIPLSYALILVLHRRSSSDSALAQLLAHRTALPLHEADEKETVLPGHIYLAPADYHLLLEADETITLDYSEKVHYSRPSIDVTFEAMADVYGPSLVGVLLSGANADGTNGLIAIKKAGGRTVVQQPDTAQVSFMPQSALDNAPVDAVLTIPELADLLWSLNAVH